MTNETTALTAGGQYIALNDIRNANFRIAALNIRSLYKNGTKLEEVNATLNDEHEIFANFIINACAVIDYLILM